MQVCIECTTWASGVYGLAAVYHDPCGTMSLLAYKVFVVHHESLVLEVQPLLTHILVEKNDLYGPCTAPKLSCGRRSIDFQMIDFGTYNMCCGLSRTIVS